MKTMWMTAPGLLWLIIACWAADIPGVSSLDEADNLYQRARYHMTELQKILRELETSHHIYKRSTDVTEQCTNLTALVQTICHSKNEMASGNKNVDSNHVEVATDLTFYKDATPPDIILSKVKGRQEGTKLIVEFEVIHSLKIYAIKMRSFDLQRKTTESTEKLETDNGDIQRNVSHMSMTFDTSGCWRDDYARDMRQFLILPEHGFTQGLVVEVDVCKYNKVYNVSEHVWQNKTTNNGVYSQVIERPKMKVLAQFDDTIFIKRGENPFFEIEVILTAETICMVSYSFWDWQLNKGESRLSNYIAMSEDDKNGLNIQSFDGEFTEKSLLQIEILNTKILRNRGDGDSDDDDDDDDETEQDKNIQPKTVHATLRVVANIGAREMSGRIILGYRWSENAYEKHHIIRSVSTDWRLTLKLPYKIREYPANTVKIHSESSVQCNENGNLQDNIFGKNCTIECYAWGTDIMSIFITRYPYRFPVKSASSVINQMSAYTIQDVGPASDDNSGDYRCTVVTKNRQSESKTISLITKGFTKVTNFTLEDLGNSTSRLICTVHGIPPLNISILTRDNKTEERLDDRLGTMKRIQSVDGSTTTLTLLVSTHELQYPREDFLECRADGKGGLDMDYVYPSESLDVYNPFIPKIIKENSTVVKGAKSDSTTTIYCYATSGGHSVDVMVSYGGGIERLRIDHKKGNTRSIKTTEEGTLLTLTVPTLSIKLFYSWIYCGAKNEYGEDWVDFDLSSYGID